MYSFLSKIRMEGSVDIDRFNWMYLSIIYAYTAYFFLFLLLFFFFFFFSCTMVQCLSVNRPDFYISPSQQLLKFPLPSLLALCSFQFHLHPSKLPLAAEPELGDHI